MGLRCVAYLGGNPRKVGQSVSCLLPLVLIMPTVASHISFIHRPVAEKTMALGGASQFAISVHITFVAPYIQNPGYGNMGPKICYIFSAFCLVA
jgi:hypothetical protein